MNSELNLRRLILLAAILAAMAVADQWLLLGSYARHWTFAVKLDVYLLVVVQAGLAAWLLGRWVARPLLCWAIYVWLLALVNALIVPDVISGEFAWPSAIVSAQLSLLAFWAAMGPAPWQWRLPATLAAGAWLVFLSHAFSVYGHDVRLGSCIVWSHPFLATPLLVEALLVWIAFTFGRSFGFRLDRSRQAEAAAAAQPGGRFQFGIGHMLVWTAAAVPALVLARNVDWTYSLSAWEQGGISALHGSLQGLRFAVVSVISIWAALAERTRRVRALVLIVTILTGGPFLDELLAAVRAVAVQPPFGIDYALHGGPGRHAARFPARGYRLIYVRRSGGPPFVVPPSGGIRAV